MTESNYSLVCNKHVESLLLWPERKVSWNIQEFEMSLNPPKAGQDKTEDASHYKWEMSRNVKLEKVRYRQEKSITPYQVTPKSNQRYRSTLNVNLVKDGKNIHLRDDYYKRGLEVKLS